MTAHGEVFADVRPASTMLVIHSLLDPRWTVEVEAEAQLRLGRWRCVCRKSPPKPGVRMSRIAASGDVLST